MRRPIRTALGASPALLLAALLWLDLAGCRPSPPAPAGPTEGGPGTAAATPDPLATRRTVTPEEREDYLGSAECLSCHPDEAEQLASHHARTLSRTTAESDGERFGDSRPVRDEENGVVYSASVRGQECVLTAKQDRLTASVTARYGLGSGHRGVTYLGEYDGKTVELRLSHYRQGGWSLTPGQQTGLPRPDTPVGRLLDVQEETDCYMCHTSALVAREGRPRPDESLGGVTCEACHGPGRAHVEAVRRKDPDLRMARLGENPAEVSSRLCSQCHRTPESVDPENPYVQSQLARFQGAALGMSECFKKSDGKLTCLSCHDPHRNSDTVTRREHIAVCVSCHSPKVAAQKPCPRKPDGDCITCHMPVQTVLMPTRPKFNTHLIKVWTR